MTEPTTSQIAVRCIECSHLFRLICSHQDNKDLCSEQLSLPAVQNEFGRFRVWAGNVGAHRSGRVSLDYRLREAGQMRQNVANLLDDLKNNLQEALDILSDKRLPYDEQLSDSNSSDSSPEETPEAPEHLTEIQQTFLDIKEIIACLYELSIALRNPVPRDRILKLASIDVSHFEEYDMRHVEQIFPQAGSFLIRRLGKANTKRRQVFKYLERHHRKLAHNIDDPLSMKAPTVIVDDRPTKERSKHVEGSETRSNIETSISEFATTLNTQTTIATFTEDNGDMIDEHDQLQSETSSAASEVHGEGGTLQVPKLPEKALDGQPFECPYCYEIIKVFSAISWRGHVFKDLEPYICTFINCALPNKTFCTRREWFDHETQIHRRKWSCHACQDSFSSKLEFGEHLKTRHRESFADHQLQALVDMCARPIDQNITAQCPLCLKEHQHIRSHMARHMRSLALFALPTVDNDDCDDMDSNGVQAGACDERDDSAAEQNELLDSDSSSDISKAAVSDTTDLNMPILFSSYKYTQHNEPLGDAETATSINTVLSKNSAQSVPGTSTNSENFDTSALNNADIVGDRYYNDGKLAEAENMYRWALDKKEKVWGPDHPSTLDTLDNLGTLYADQGKLAEAEEMSMRSFVGKKKTLRRDHRSTLDIHFGTLYHDQGKLAEAEQMYSRALNGTEKALGPDHPSTLDIMDKLGTLYTDQGKLAEAERMFLRALDGKEKALGPDHPSTLNVILKLGNIYKVQGKLAEAEQMFRRALNGTEKAQGRSLMIA